MPGSPEFQKQLQSVEQLLGKIEAAADRGLRATVQELVQIIMNLHGEGLERMLELVRVSGDGGDAIVQRMGCDELVGSLLVLYGLHPSDLETRVKQALDKVQSRLRVRDGEAELLGIEDGSVRLRLRAEGHGCGATAESLKEIVEEAIYRAAPDVTGLVVESADTKQNFVPLELLQGTAPAGAKAGV